MTVISGLYVQYLYDSSSNKLLGFVSGICMTAITGLYLLQ